MLKHLLLLTLLLPVYSAAHEMRPAYIEVRELASGNHQVVFRQPRIQDKFLDLQLDFSCERLDDGQTGLGIASLAETTTFNCPNGLRGETLTVIGLERTMTNALVRIIPLNADPSTLLIHPDSPYATFGKAVPLSAYLMLGVEHLLFGFDHVLFVLGLLYLVTGRWRLVQTVTSFTLAHSITLALSVTGVVQLSQALVEALIALTILYLAVEIAYRARPLATPMKYPGVIAFSFGLLHGLGFAGALREIGLPDDALFTSLLLFNVGIELGQMLVIILAIVMFQLLRRFKPALDTSTTRLRWIPVYMMGGVSVYWVLTRVLDMVQPALVS